MRAVKKSTLFALVLSLICVLINVLPAGAAPLIQSDDPVAACASGVELANSGQFVEALPLLEAGFAGRTEANFETSEDLGDCAFDLGYMRYEAGDRSGAREAYEVALQIFLDSGNWDYKEKINHIGVFYRQQGQFSKALQVYQQLLDKARELDDRAVIGRALNNIGVVYNQQGRFAEALENFQLVLDIRREDGERIGEGNMLTNIGEAHRKLGNYGEALENFQQALVIHREVGSLEWEGSTLNDIGLVYDELGRPDEAQIQYRAALEIWNETENLVEEANTLGNIGYSLQRQNRLDEALEYHQQTLEIKREVEDQFGEGITLNNIGELYRSLDRYDDAVEAFKQALDIARQLGDRVGEGTTLNSLGSLLDAQGQHAEALEYFQRSLPIRQEVGDRLGEALTLYNLGDTSQDLGQTEQAWQYYEQALDVLETVRADSGSEQGRSGFIAQYSDLYTSAVEFYARENQVEDAYFTSERARARAFLDSLASKQVQLGDGEAAALYKSMHETDATRRTAQESLAQARRQDPPNQELIANLELELRAAEKEYLEAFLLAIESRSDLADLVSSRSTILELSEVQALLDEQTTLLSYFLLEEGGSLAFIVTRDDISMIELPEATGENLRSAITDLEKWINKENPHPLPLQNLYKWLVAPLLDQIHTQRLGIIPHQILHYLPFAALSDGGSYLGERFLLFNQPSASAYRFIQQNAQNASRAAGNPALVFGNPKVSERGLVPLQYAENEANTVAKLIEIQAFTGEQASEEQFWAKANNAEVIHLAAHGSYNPLNPLSSAIHLARAGEHDGLLQAYEIYGLDLSTTDLVVLSACQTNVGELSAGDELVGLTRAFFSAGSPSILSSLWSVDDAATAALMDAFYRHWLGGKSKAEALQAAQAEVRQSYPSPYFWAAFVLNGDPGVNSSITETENPPPDDQQPSELQSSETPSTAKKPGMGLCNSPGAALIFGISIWFLNNYKRRR